MRFWWLLVLAANFQSCHLAGNSIRTMVPSATSQQKPNRLAREKSPYLLQHAYNPVDWYPWGEEAFKKARQEQKPIFLSIGYSTCHWCHVMEHESFEDPEIAALMNRWFVCIKVDREEHPDVDQVYMSAVMRMQGQGGWPLNVFLTPELKPFFGGTYFPPQRRWQTPGMREILPSVAEAWSRRRDELASSAEKLTESLKESLESAQQSAPLTAALLDAAFSQAMREFDPVHGGFGTAPKFPRSHELAFLLRYALRTGNAHAREMVEVTLDNLDRGGIHDHLGGGFHRYSTDAQWLVPHFEKMLYDQALLAIAYLEAYRFTRKARYAAVARDILEYVLRDLRDPGGAFHCAEDADSEGVEGKFYAWTPQAVIAVLGLKDGGLFNAVYGVTPQGSFEQGSVLALSRPIEEAAQAHGMQAAQLDKKLADCRAKLLNARNRRVHPHKDDKILTSWNGLMIAALAQGAAALDEPRYAEAAEQAAGFIVSTLVDKQANLLRRYREGQALYAGTLEEYAFFCFGLLELYEADYDTRWLALAKRLADRMIAQFWDARSGGFFLRSREETPLIVASKEFYDGATPSGNSMAIGVLARLGRLLGNASYEEHARRALEQFIPALTSMPWAATQMLQAADFFLGPAQEVVIAARHPDASTQALLRQLHERFLPRTLSILRTEETAKALAALAAYSEKQEALGGAATAYVCRQYAACDRPVTSAQEFARLLDAAYQP